MERVFCHECGAECRPSGCSTGYGTDQEGRKFCFACCAKRDRAEMCETGRFTGYLTQSGAEAFVSNWPGSLKFEVYERRASRHNIGGERTDVWFDGPDGHQWHGVHIGQYNEIARCRRTKRPARVS